MGSAGSIHGQPSERCDESEVEYQQKLSDLFRLNFEQIQEKVGMLSRAYPRLSSKENGLCERVPARVNQKVFENDHQGSGRLKTHPSDS